MAHRTRLFDRANGAIPSTVGRAVLATVLMLALMPPAGAQQTGVKEDGAAAGPAARHDADSDYSRMVGARRIEVPRRLVRLLTPEASRKLKILPIPTDHPIPLIVGSIWQCVPAPAGFEECKPVLVFCTNDQGFCGTVP